MIYAMIQAAMMVAIALREAKDDADAIEAHRRIDHVSGWMERAFFAVTCAALLSLWATAIGEAPFLRTLTALCLLSYGVFTPVFRYRLNTLRGLGWDYVSLSSLYDTAFIVCFADGAGRAAYAVEGIAAAVALIITYIHAT